jgi:hypothetical protein
MAIVGSTQMAIDAALTAEAARLHQEIVYTQVSNEHGSRLLPLWGTPLPELDMAQNITFLINKWVDPRCAGLNFKAEPITSAS